MAANFQHNYHIKLIYPKIRHSVVHSWQHKHHGNDWRKAIESWYELHKSILVDLVAIAVCGLEVYYVGHGWCRMWDEDQTSLWGTIDA